MDRYPKKLQDIIDLFEVLPEPERRENLIAYADQAEAYEPIEGQPYDLEDVRKDEECTDTVGIFLTVRPDVSDLDPARGHLTFRVSLGPEVQTLTRAMTAILCQSFEGETPMRVIDLPQDFVPRIIGQDLVRARSQTVYYVLGRMKSACRVYLDRKRAQ